MKKRLAVVFMTLMLLSCCSGVVYANDLNGVGTETRASGTDIEVVEEITQADTKDETATTSKPAEEKAPTKDFIDIPAASEDFQQSQEDAAKAVGEMFQQASLDEESVKKAQVFLEPIAQLLNLVFAVILGITSLLLLFITVLDLLYMAFPPIRDLLDGGKIGDAMPNSSNNHRQQNRLHNDYTRVGQMPNIYESNDDYSSNNTSSRKSSSTGGGLSAIGRWVSDEAIAACLETKGGAQGRGAVKLMIFSYAKKRSLFLAMFGVCAVLFTSSAFTNLGTRVGLWILGLITGLGN